MNLVKTVVVALIAGSVGVFGALSYVDRNMELNQSKEVHQVLYEGNSVDMGIPSKVNNTVQRKIDPSVEGGFVEASKLSTPSVVFIKNVSNVRYSSGHWMDWFFEPRTSQQVSTGSGVFYSKDGYIITNNHVIEDADEIEVIHNKRTYNAELIGTDPSTDLAVIKLEGNDFPLINLGSSEGVQVGEWVLAVGNPFNLTSTVTAGIVSAKGRNINILRDKFPIESFIQTDAAINPGNSGGALVNVKGELIGINTAILSRTGSYAGYGFAIPVDIVKKVASDLINYGEVQKVFLGAEYIDIDSKIAQELEVEGLNGVIITHVQDNWASDKAGLKKGDIILAINDKVIEGKSDLEERLGYLYPGDEMVLKIKRGDKAMVKNVILTNREGTTEVIKKVIYKSESLKVTFEKVSKVEQNLLGIEGGVKVVEIGAGFFSKLDIPQSFIITEINNTPIESPEKLEDILVKIRGRVIISGINSRGKKVYYPYMF
ncbi:trypsin-like peptidase domain-containing protein [Reichenbachiella sp. MALMAid0571]|uniref:S1C family serine protease n=1 Tax=Reichenbachiella sp. MALMAid0571 TaxID=3143939 RepID=UPI0032E0236A